MIGIVFGISRRNSNDLVLVSRVDHGHQANRPRMHHGQWHHGILAEHQDVERIMVFGHSGARSMDTGSKDKILSGDGSRLATAEQRLRHFALDTKAEEIA